MKMGKLLFVIGTGTDVGKTYAAGLLVKKLHEGGLSAGYFKAAMSGNDRGPDGALIPGDAMAVRRMAGIAQPPESMCPYVYEAAVSPHLAARLEGRPIELDRVLDGLRQVRARYDYVTLEGAGGILCPLRWDQTRLLLPDLIRACGADCLLVADAGLGTINAAALTAAYLRTAGIALRGILLNRFRPGDAMHEDNLRMCEQLTGSPVVACVREGAEELDLPLERLTALYR